MRDRSIRIFLVEDSPILRDRLSEMLETWSEVKIVGHAETEADAEKALRENRWDILILDLQLLQGTGLGVLRSLNAHRRPGSVVVVLTNYSIPLYRARSMQLGADYFFDKSQEFESIRDVLDETVRRNSARRAEQTSA